GFSIREGPAVLEVAATGGWEVLVDQQVETPASEPELAGMTDASLVAEGDFYGIDQEGTGKAALYRLPDGRRALRLEPFVVTPNSDLFVWVSETEAPRTSEQALHSAHVQVQELTATAGAQNYLLPDDIDATRIRSVVIWCEPVRTAYAAAALARS
ncbi:MAG: DM13 domain-containing protein, partial [Acidimicrobiales bacterium]